MRTAMIFAAGLGTRLKPLTDSVPKALVSVGGVPMLARLLLKLRSAGVERCVVNACHLAPMIVDYLERNDFGITVDVSIEEGGTPFETGGGVKHARNLLEHKCGEEKRFLVHNVDILSDLDIRWFVAQDSGHSLATLLLVDEEADRCLLFDEDMYLKGWMNNVTGEVKSPYPDFNPSRYRKYSFCGVHIISERVFPLMEIWPEKFGIIDFYLSACSFHPIRGVVADNLKMMDIGSPAALAEAEAFINGHA